MWRGLTPERPPPCLPQAPPLTAGLPPPLRIRSGAPDDQWSAPRTCVCPRPLFLPLPLPPSLVLSLCPFPRLYAVPQSLSVPRRHPCSSHSLLPPVLFLSTRSRTLVLSRACARTRTLAHALPHTRAPDRTHTRTLWRDAGAHAHALGRVRDHTWGSIQKIRNDVYCEEG